MTGAAALTSTLRRVRRAGSATHGFTLIELLVSMSVLAIVLGPLAFALTTVASTSSITMNQEALLSQAHAAVETMVIDLREAYTGTAALATIASMSGTQLTFYAPDTEQPFHLMKISYQLSGGNLQRAFALSTNTGGPPWTVPALGAWTTVVGSVSNATVFTYQDANGNPTSTPAQVSRVLVTVTITPAGGGSPTTYQDSATIRATAST